MYIQIKCYRDIIPVKKINFFCVCVCAGCIISFLVLETLIKESQFSWMFYKYVILIRLQRKKDSLRKEPDGGGSRGKRGVGEKNDCLAFYGIHFYFNYTTVCMCSLTTNV